MADELVTPEAPEAPAVVVEAPKPAAPAAVLAAPKVAAKAPTKAPVPSLPLPSGAVVK